jgi:hypothetical protein
MKGVLFLGLVGAAIYGAILLSNDLLPHESASNALSGQSLRNAEDRKLRSWGTDLPALASSNSQEAPVAVRNLAAMGSPSPVVASANSQSVGTAYQPVEWAKVAFAAKVHSDASVSSPTLRFYQPGTALQVVSRQNGWVHVTDPNSGERGWVFEQYLQPADGPTATPSAIATAATALPERANPMPSAKKRVRAPRPAARRSHDFAAAQFDRRWERRAQRRGGFGLFFFGRFARAE